MFTVTQETLVAVNEAWSDFLDSNWTFYDNHDNDAAYDCELYLYVMADGRWTIDHAQYFTNWNDVITMAPISHYQSRKELRTELEMNSYEWEMATCV